jgi:hypothetical protein
MDCKRRILLLHGPVILILPSVARRLPRTYIFVISRTQHGDTYRVNERLYHESSVMTVSLSFTPSTFVSDALETLVVEPATERALATEPIGAKARRIFLDFDLMGSPRHPPFRAAFYPVVREAVVVVTVAACLFIAGFAVKRSTGKSLYRQATEMFALWFNQHIDPPTYYAQDLYLPAKMALSAHYLTRFETKNGLMTALNSLTKRPYVKHEMNDKALFASVCSDAGVAHVPILATTDTDGLHWHVARDSVAFDLFCKRRNGMGAKGTLAFRHLSSNRFSDSEGQVLSLAEIEARVVGQSKPMLLQPWLRNHEDLANLAKDSLLTVRVITCINEQGKPEVCLAMLRLLSILEPDWQHLPDGEYAAPIDLKTGVLGLLTGDAMETSVVRMAMHPVTGVQVEGRLMPEWDAIKALALKLHAHVPHRAMIGWDIAVTPNGPVMLEGNNNFDVMFLQRVQDAPASASRFGSLMAFHLDRLKIAKASAISNLV